jgi:SAM-dependent methyltransferase
MAGTRMRRRALSGLWRIRAPADYHGLLYDEALARYAGIAKRLAGDLGSVLAVGACFREVEALCRRPFSQIVLSGIAEPDDATLRACERDPRVRYELADVQSLPWPSQHFDLVLCKESLHHAPRPVQGLYEMLRVCRRAAILIEPWECAALRALDRLGLATRFERDQALNAGGRDNHVFRFGRHALESLLRSLYLESGWGLDVTVGWMSGRAQLRAPRGLRRAASLAGFAASWLPGAAGNLASIVIVPGLDRPPEPDARPAGAVAHGREAGAVPARVASPQG